MVNLFPAPVAVREDEVEDARIDIETSFTETLTVRRQSRGIASDGQAMVTESTFTTPGTLRPITGDVAATFLGLVGDETWFLRSRWDKPLMAGDEVSGDHHPGLAVFVRSAFAARPNGRDDLWWTAAAAEKRRVS